MEWKHEIKKYVSWIMWCNTLFLSHRMFIYIIYIVFRMYIEIRLSTYYNHDISKYIDVFQQNTMECVLEQKLTHNLKEPISQALCSLVIFTSNEQKQQEQRTQATRKRNTPGV